MIINSLDYRKKSNKFISISILIASLFGTNANADPVGLLDAVRFTLTKNPDIQIQKKQVEISQGALLQATGQFDLGLRFSAGHNIDNSPLNQQTRDGYAMQGFPISRIKTETTTYNIALEKPLRNGIVLSPNISATSNSGTINDLSNLAMQHQSKIDFTLRVPLLKGSGEVAAFGETTANLDWEASKQDLRYLTSQNILNTVVAYWSLLATKKNLDIAHEAEASIRQMVAETRKLIEADEFPASDLNVVKANLLDKIASRISVEQAELDARQRLRQAMGLPYTQSTTLEPSDDFPSMDTKFSALERKLGQLIELAITRRADLAAARLRQDSAKILTNVAQNNLKPQLDLTVSVGYAKLTEGGSVINGIGQYSPDVGANISANISYQWSFDNNVARGRYLQQEAVYDQSTINAATVERSIGIGVKASLDGLTLSAQQLKESKETVDLYRITLENEKTKHKLGNATLIDVLTVNDRLFSARLNKISYWLNYLNALVRLNFETGALLPENTSEQSIRLDQLISVSKLN